MILVDKDQMQKIDRYAIDELGIPSLVLVERASLAVLKHINLNKYSKFAVVASVGNNGADGLALARNLLSLGKRVDIFILGSIDKASEDFRINLRACKNLTDAIYDFDTLKDLADFEKRISNSQIIIDAIFGTGLNRPVSGLFATVISIMNNVMKYKISIDLPSGLDASTGADLGEVVDADLIIVMQLMKKGLYLREKYKDKCRLEDIGIPKKAIEHILG